MDRLQLTRLTNSANTRGRYESQTRTLNFTRNFKIILEYRTFCGKHMSHKNFKFHEINAASFVRSFAFFFFFCSLVESSISNTFTVEVFISINRSMRLKIFRTNGDLSFGTIRRENILFRKKIYYFKYFVLSKHRKVSHIYLKMSIKSLLKNYMKFLHSFRKLVSWISIDANLILSYTMDHRRISGNSIFW